MNVTLEGPDGSGKSTLSKLILEAFPQLRLQQGMGPPKYPGEMNERIKKYLGMDNTLFDRHPAVSEPIYGRHRETPEEINPQLLVSFYANPGLLIYCSPNPGIPSTHILGDHDTEDHVRLIQEYDMEIRADYRIWAENYAHLHHTLGDPWEALQVRLEHYLS